MTLRFDVLQQACSERAKEWDDPDLPLSYFGNELAGEVGEACNVVKKLERARYGMVGSRDTVDHLADECGDAMICLVRLANKAGFDLGEITHAKFNRTSAKNGLTTMISEDGTYVYHEPVWHLV